MKNPITDFNSIFRTVKSAGLTIQSKTSETGASYSVQLTGTPSFWIPTNRINIHPFSDAQVDILGDALEKTSGLSPFAKVFP